MFNNGTVVTHLAARLDPSELNLMPKPRHRISHDPCLPARLPSTAVLRREGENSGPRAIIRQLRRSPTPPTGEEESSTYSRYRADGRTNSSRASPVAASQLKALKTGTTAGWKDPQPYEVFRAIEGKDIIFLMEVRDRAFHLLLRRTGDATPLLHAMRIGESHRDIAILLLGAFSRWVNHLQDDEVRLPRTTVLLKALRANLKLAIDFGLQRSQSDLIASFLQTLIMSEGDKWVWSQVSNVALALRAGTGGKPVETAEKSCRAFATRELGKAEIIASLEDYIANATADLLMMATWSIALDSIEGEQIPAYYFARDDRVYKAFSERLIEHWAAINHALNRRLRWQLRVLNKVLEGRTTTYRSKVELLAGELDEGEGV